MALEDIAKRYFTSINTMANRICIDQDETRSIYKDLWKTLTLEEQQKILSESILKPEVILKYHLYSKFKNDEKSGSSKLAIDEHYSYRDEYSAPFSLRTGSQRNLAILSTISKKIATDDCKNDKKCLTKNAAFISNSSYSCVEVLNHESFIIQKCAESVKQFLPKTGLDFLDNW